MHMCARFTVISNGDDCIKWCAKTDEFEERFAVDISLREFTSLQQQFVPKSERLGKR